MKYATIFTIVLSTCTLVVMSSGCNNNDSREHDDDDTEESASANLAMASTNQAEYESAVIMSGVANDEQSLGQATTATIAASIAIRLEARYTPPACIEVDRTDSTVTATLDDCAGPFGLRNVSGQLAIEVTSVGDGSVSTTTTATGFTAAGATFDFEADATYEEHGASHQLAVSSEASGVGVFGLAFARTGDYEATWTDECVAIDGAWTVTNGVNALTSHVDIEHCNNECPIGTIDVVGAGGSLHIVYDGSVNVQWNLGPLSGTITLQCEAQ